MKKLNREEKNYLKQVFFTLFCFLPLKHDFPRLIVLSEQEVLWSNPIQLKTPLNSRPVQLEREAETQRDPNLTLPCEKTDRQAFS